MARSTPLHKFQPAFNSTEKCPLCAPHSHKRGNCRCDSRYFVFHNFLSLHENGYDLTRSRPPTLNRHIDILGRSPQYLAWLVNPKTNSSSPTQCLVTTGAQK